MKRNFKMVSAIVLVTMIFTLMTVGINGSNAVDALEVDKEVKIITSNGMAVMSARPDVAYITVGVIEEGKELADIQDKSNKKMTSVIEELEALGIEEKDIKTLNFNISPKYDWSEKSEGRIVGYIVNNMVQVTINDLNKVGIVIDKVSLNGSNSISNLRFGLKDESALYNKALELAVKDAKEKAEAMGAGAGIKNIAVSKITETSQRNNTVINREADMVNKLTGASTPINTGELKVSASVTVDFSF